MSAKTNGLLIVHVWLAAFWVQPGVLPFAVALVHAAMVLVWSRQDAKENT